MTFLDAPAIAPDTIETTTEQLELMLSTRIPGPLGPRRSAPPVPARAHVAIQPVVPDPAAPARLVDAAMGIIVLAAALVGAAIDRLIT